MTDQLDATVGNELAEVQADAGSLDTSALKKVIDGLIVNSPGIYYLLQASDSQVLAGNMMAVKPVPGARTLEPFHQKGKCSVSCLTSNFFGLKSLRDSTQADIALERVQQTQDRHALGGIRGRGIGLPDGTYLFVGISDYQMGEVRAVIVRTFLLGLVVTVVLAVAGGLIMSFGVLRRVEAVSRASRAIMTGDLSQRMTLLGTDDEFDHLSNSLNAMLDRIQALMLGLQQVSSDIAHDLRTPLSRLRQRLELARQRENTVEALNTTLDGAIGNVDAILDTFGALLRIAQIEAGTRRSSFQPVALSTLLDKLVEAYQPVAEEKAQVLRSDISSDLWVNGDRELLTQLFANLIDNAIGHCQNDTRLLVEAALTPQDVVVVVSDTGPGIPVCFHRKVLQRFYRLETSRTTPGNGLGLSLVAAVVGLHQATLDFQDNKPGLRCVLHFRPK